MGPPDASASFAPAAILAQFRAKRVVSAQDILATRHHLWAVIDGGATLRG
jgi:hypothetical protein